MTKRKIKFTTQFKRDYKRCRKRGLDISLIDHAINLLENRCLFPEHMRDHHLVGTYIGLRECHMAPDWLLIYEINDDDTLVKLSRTGTHADLLNK